MVLKQRGFICAYRPNTIFDPITIFRLWPGFSYFYPHVVLEEFTAGPTTSSDYLYFEVEIFFSLSGESGNFIVYTNLEVYTFTNLEVP